MIDGSLATYVVYGLFLLPATEGEEKVMFSVCLSVHQVGGGVPHGQASGYPPPLHRTRMDVQCGRYAFSIHAEGLSSLVTTLAGGGDMLTDAQNVQVF